MVATPFIFGRVSPVSAWAGRWDHIRWRWGPAFRRDVLGPVGGESGPVWGWLCAWRVLEGAERPAVFEPGQDRTVEHRVEGGVVGAHPGPDPCVLSARTAVLLAVAGQRVDINAADDIVVCGAEHGVGKPAAFSEVLCVAFEVAEIICQAHRMRPARAGESGGRPDVADARRPCGVVRGVVLGPEWFQPELLGRQPVRHGEIRWDEQLVTHQPILTAGLPLRLRSAAGSASCAVGSPLPITGSGVRMRALCAPGVRWWGKEAAEDPGEDVAVAVRRVAGCLRRAGAGR